MWLTGICPASNIKHCHEQRVVSSVGLLQLSPLWHWDTGHLCQYLGTCKPSNIINVHFMSVDTVAMRHLSVTLLYFSPGNDKMIRISEWRLNVSVECAGPGEGGQELGEGGVQEVEQGAVHLHRGGQDSVLGGVDRGSVSGRAFTISEKLIEFWVNNSVFYPISKR